MAIYNIADLNIEINPKTDFAKNGLNPYISRETKSNFAVKISEQDIEYEIAAAGGECQLSAEFVAIFRKICKEVLLNYNGMFLHCAAIKYKGKAYLFTAPSGTGKTTHICLWKKYLGDSVEIINGDKPILREENGIITVYGTPWQGKENLGGNIKAPLGGVIILQRGLKNSTEKVSNIEAITFLMSQTLRPADKDSVDRLLCFIDKMVRAAPIIKLSCNISQEAVDTALCAVEKL